MESKKSSNIMSSPISGIMGGSMLAASLLFPTGLAPSQAEGSSASYKLEYHFEAKPSYTGAYRVETSHQNLEKFMISFYKDLSEKQTFLDDRSYQILEDNLWDLYQT